MFVNMKTHSYKGGKYGNSKRQDNRQNGKPAKYS